MCGLRWPCPDRRRTPPPAEPFPIPIPEPRPRPAWTDPTVELNPVGRAGWLTPGQTYRAQGRRGK